MNIKGARTIRKRRLEGNNKKFWEMTVVCDRSNGSITPKPEVSPSSYRGHEVSHSKRSEARRPAKLEEERSSKRSEARSQITRRVVKLEAERSENARATPGWRASLYI